MVPYCLRTYNFSIYVFFIRSKKNIAFNNESKSAKSKTVYLCIILHNNLNTQFYKKSKITNKPALKQIAIKKIYNFNDNITCKLQFNRRSTTFMMYL